LRIAQDLGISSLITIIPGVAPSQQQSKSLYSSGPVDQKTNYSIPFNKLPWAMDLIQAVDAKQAILLHGHWQSGKTSALRFLKSRAEDQGIKVYYFDMLAEFDALKRFLTALQRKKELRETKLILHQSISEDETEKILPVL